MGLYLTFGLYVLVLVGIGVYFFATTETRRLVDYMLAGRDVGTWPIAISEVASVASGWTFFAWVGVGFTTGLGGLCFSVAMLAVVLFMYRFVAPTFRRQSEAVDSQTVVDHLALQAEGSRFGAPILHVSFRPLLLSYPAPIAGSGLRGRSGQRRRRLQPLSRAIVP